MLFAIIPPCAEESLGCQRLTMAKRLYLTVFTADFWRVLEL